MDQCIQAAGIELGGTNVSVAIGIVKVDEFGHKTATILEKAKFDTEDPQKTVDKIIYWLKNKKIDFIGFASFGPLILDKESPKYGSISTAPKIQWTNFPLCRAVTKPLGLENNFRIETDVNACAIAEFKLGKHNIKDSLAYITIGTGVGVGLIINGQCVHGMLHPEAGHIRINKLPEDMDFEGVCAYHGDCLEGLCTNRSIAKRLNCQVNDLATITDDNPIWERVGYYIANLCLNLSLIASCEVIIIGGGVTQRKILYPIIRKEFKKLLNKYLVTPQIEDLDNYIKPPSLGTEVGMIGAMIL